MEAMQQLAGVSRLWRDVILDTPSCWNSIRVAQDVKLAHLWIQLKRSCQALLHVSIRYWWSNDATRRRQFEAQLKLIASTTCRWKTLSVGENAVWFTRAINRFLHSDFLSLTKGHIDTDATSDLIAILTRTPILEDLSVKGPVAFTIPRLKLQVLRLQHKTLPTPVSSDTMTSLTLIGGAKHWELERDSIHFPLLETLSLEITHPAKFMAAIVAPKLRYFEYSTARCDDFDQSNLVVFSDLRGKFTQVCQVQLQPDTYANEPVGAARLCYAFPGVRHATIN